MRVASWNVNSVRLRLPHLLNWLDTVSPDVACIQELKCLEEQFPAAEIEAKGYNIAIFGQKSFNGVALLSKHPLSDIRFGLPGDPTDVQARYIEAVIPAGKTVMRIASIYLPNGNPPNTDKFQYKLAWMERLTTHAEALLAYEEPLVLAGDFNVIPEPRDAKEPSAWVNDALFLPQTRAAFRKLEFLGFVDALRAVDSAADRYTFWDYQGAAWQRNNGIRIDHLLLSPQAADRLESVSIDKAMRALEKPSDHVPIRADFRFD